MEKHPVFHAVDVWKRLPDGVLHLKKNLAYQRSPDGVYRIQAVEKQKNPVRAVDVWERSSDGVLHLKKNFAYRRSSDGVYRIHTVEKQKKSEQDIFFTG